MSLINTAKKFGSVTKFLHWCIVLLFINQFAVVYWREFLEKTDPLKLQLILLHKAMGVILLGLGLLMLIWHYLGTRPPFPANMNPFMCFAAKSAHFGLYFCLLLMPSSGIMMSLYADKGVKVFGWALPNFVAKNTEIAKLIKTGHVTLSYIITVLVALHVSAALYHHFIRKDNILLRMLPFKNTN